MAKKREASEDKSIHIAQHSKVEGSLKIREFPWSAKQKEFMALIERKDSNIVICKGPAGTAKSLCAVTAALKAMNEKKISQIAYIRAIVESTSHPLGYLKGSLEDKIDPYLAPLFEKIQCSLEEAESMRKQANSYICMA